jgi:hypothetical protein
MHPRKDPWRHPQPFTVPRNQGCFTNGASANRNIRYDPRKTMRASGNCEDLVQMRSVGRTAAPNGTFRTDRPRSPCGGHCDRIDGTFDRAPNDLENQIGGCLGPLCNLRAALNCGRCPPLGAVAQFPPVGGSGAGFSGFSLVEMGPARPLYGWFQSSGLPIYNFPAHQRGVSNHRQSLWLEEGPKKGPYIQQDG